MASVKAVAGSFWSGEKKTIVTTAAVLLIWWGFIGKKKYSAKGGNHYGRR